MNASGSWKMGSFICKRCLKLLAGVQSKGGHWREALVEGATVSSRKLCLYFQGCIAGHRPVNCLWNSLVFLTARQSVHTVILEHPKATKGTSAHSIPDMEHVH